jgi:hypothetical protein
MYDTEEKEEKANECGYTMRRRRRKCAVNSVRPRGPTSSSLSGATLGSQSLFMQLCTAKNPVPSL